MLCFALSTSCAPQVKDLSFDFSVGDMKRVIDLDLYSIARNVVVVSECNMVSTVRSYT